MIGVAKGNLLRAETEALVNTVNCVGYMGKGIALQFKKEFPENFDYYQKACCAKELQPGRMLVYETGKMIGPRFIINFPTKQHWRGNSKYEYIQSGLKALVAEIQLRKIRSIALPPLGCGLGGLDWARVRPMIDGNAYSSLSDAAVAVIQSTGSKIATEDGWRFWTYLDKKDNEWKPLDEVRT